jgi:hypothetical protein
MLKLRWMSRVVDTSFLRLFVFNTVSSLRKLCVGALRLPDDEAPSYSLTSRPGVAILVSLEKSKIV